MVYLENENYLNTMEILLLDYLTAKTSCAWQNIYNPSRDSCFVGQFSKLQSSERANLKLK